MRGVNGEGGGGGEGGGRGGGYYIVNFVSISKVCRISFPLYILNTSIPRVDIK